MTIEIETRIEGKRGCGYRKPGGLYLIGPPTGHNCCKLPFPLTICPCCGAGIRPARAWTWVNSEKLFRDEPCVAPLQADLARCPLSRPQDLGTAGLVWIGEKFYPTPESFLKEAREMGISRRIGTVPKDFKLGETWVLLAHRKGIIAEETYEGAFQIQNVQHIWRPAIFSVFKPTAVEYVVKGNETEEDLERIVKRGLTPIVVKNRVPYV
jgi:hypothetical protein